ncbi:hypothetical protein Tco_0051955 [Tanacetum coccineum]
MVQTPSHVESTDDKDGDEEIQDANVEGDKMNEEAEVDALYRDVNVNLEGRDTEMTDALRTIIQTTQVIEDTHVIITLVYPEGQQQGSSVSCGFKLMNEIGELRAISGQVLGVAGVQIPLNNLENLQSIREEEDGATKASVPRDVPGSILLAVTDFAALGLLLGTDLDWNSTLFFSLLPGVREILSFFVLPKGFDPLALVEGFTLVEDNKGLLVTLGILLDDAVVSVNRTVFFLLIGVTATNFSLDL